MRRSASAQAAAGRRRSPPRHLVEVAEVVVAAADEDRAVREDGGAMFGEGQDGFGRRPRSGARVVDFAVRRRSSRRRPVPTQPDGLQGVPPVTRTSPPCRSEAGSLPRAKRIVAPASRRRSRGRRFRCSPGSPPRLPRDFGQATGDEGLAGGKEGRGRPDPGDVHRRYGESRSGRRVEGFRLGVDGLAVFERVFGRPHLFVADAAREQHLAAGQRDGGPFAFGARERRRQRGPGSVAGENSSAPGSAPYSCGPRRPVTRTFRPAAGSRCRRAGVRAAARSSSRCRRPGRRFRRSAVLPLPRSPDAGRRSRGPGRRRGASWSGRSARRASAPPPSSCGGRVEEFGARLGDRVAADPFDEPVEPTGDEHFAVGQRDLRLLGAGYAHRRRLRPTDPGGGGRSDAGQGGEGAGEREKDPVGCHRAR